MAACSAIHWSRDFGMVAMGGPGRTDGGCELCPGSQAERGRMQLLDRFQILDPRHTPYIVESGA